MQAQEYQKEKQHFLENVVDGSCWDNECKGKVVVLAQSEAYKEEGIEHLRIAKCNICGKGFSFWTFTQWTKNRKEGARRTIKEAKDDRRKARQEYAITMAVARANRDQELQRIKQKVEEAQRKLKED